MECISCKQSRLRDEMLVFSAKAYNQIAAIKRKARSQERPNNLAEANPQIFVCRDCLVLN